MAIVFPSAAIASRWNGALQARLMRAPLEAFLRSRGGAPARAGLAQDSDNVTRAAVQIIETALATVNTERPTGTPLSDNAIVGHLACIVARSLASSIERPDAWRIAALLSTAQLLSPWMGLTDAAVASAAYVRRFESEGARESAMDTQVALAAINAVRNGGAAVFAAASAQIASRLRGFSSNSSEVAVAAMTALALRG